MRRWCVFSALFAVLATAGAGCGGDDSDLVAGRVPADATTPASSGESSGGGEVPVDEDAWEPYVIAAGGLTGTRTSPDAQSLLVTFVGGAPYVAGEHCTVAYRAEADEPRDEVVVRLFSNAPPPPDEENWDCTAEGHFRSVEIDLDAPLGDRAVREDESQRRLEVFDGSLLAEPTWMPDGWTLRSEQAGYPAPENASYWERTWGPEPLPPTGNTCTPTDGPICSHPRPCLWPRA